MNRMLQICTAIIVATGVLFAEEKSVNPGINKSFENPNVPDFIERFEKEGRDAFDHRKEILAALDLKPGMTVADIGTGTGLFARAFAPLVGAVLSSLVLVMKTPASLAAPLLPAIGAERTTAPASVPRSSE